MKFVPKQTYQELSKKYSVVVHQAGQGMSQNMAILGLGQIFLPSYPEGAINTSNALRLNLGKAFNPSEQKDLNHETIKKAINELLKEESQKKIWEIKI